MSSEPATTCLHGHAACNTTAAKSDRPCYYTDIHGPTGQLGVMDTVVVNWTWQLCSRAEMCRRCIGTAGKPQPRCAVKPQLSTVDDHCHADDSRLEDHLRTDDAFKASYDDTAVYVVRLMYHFRNYHARDAHRVDFLDLRLHTSGRMLKSTFAVSSSSLWTTQPTS